MKKLLAFLTFLLFLLLIWFSWNWYRDTVLCCPDAVAKETGVLYYKCGTADPITTDGWAAKKEEIINMVPEGKNLLIVGPYFDGEKREKGLVRAEKVKALFTDKMSSDKIVTDARPAGDCEAGLKDVYHNTIFKDVIRNEHVVQFHDKTYIYFKYDSTKELDTQHVVKFLNDLIAELKASGKTVVLTGHTDHDGTDEYNYELGLERANHVKAYLVKHGLPESQIEVKSKGKSEPIADNSTPEGKQKNRRVEIVIK